MATENTAPELRMDPATLYREEIFTDRRVGTIRVLTPVKDDGSADGEREILYLGEAQLLTPVGTLPIGFQIDASNLAEAVARFGETAKVAVERTMKELQEMRREAASSIVIPDRMPGGGLGGAGGPRGGKIQMP